MARTHSDHPTPGQRFQSPEHASRAFGQWAEQASSGGLNVVSHFYLNPSATETTVSDLNVSRHSWVGFQPVTATAATESGNGTLYIESQTNGSFVVKHSSTADVDRIFQYAVLTGAGAGSGSDQGGGPGGGLFDVFSDEFSSDFS